MKKIFLVLLLLIISVFTLSSCMDTTQLNSLLGNIPFLNTHTCADLNGDTLCDTCSAYVAPAACTSHIDNNSDGVCDNVGCNASVLIEMLDVVFNNRSYTYDGKPKTIEVKGAPEGAVIE